MASKFNGVENNNYLNSNPKKSLEIVRPGPFDMTGKESIIKLTLNEIPVTSEFAKSIGISIGGVYSPFAQDFIPKVLSENITRCSRCRSYINLYYKFVNDGKEFICNLCNSINNVPKNYYCKFGYDNKRIDENERPELINNTIDFVLDNDQNNYLCVAFLFEITKISRESGFLDYALSAIEKSLIYMTNNKLKVKVALIGFDYAIHFFEFKKMEMKIKVSSDLQNLKKLKFDNKFIQIKSNEHIKNLIDNLKSYIWHQNYNYSCLGSSLDLCSCVMKNIGGKINLFVKSACNLGPYNQKKKLSELKSKYNILTNSFIEKGISLSIYSGVYETHCLNMITDIPNKTNGRIYTYNNTKHYFLIVKDALSDLQKFIAFDCTVMFRCSSGLNISDYYGNFTMLKLHELKFPMIYKRDAVSFKFVYEDTFNKKQRLFLQTALKYLNPQGKTMLRVTTIIFKTTSVYKDLFKSINYEVVFNLSIKKAIREIKIKEILDYKKAIVKACIKVLSSFKRHCINNKESFELIIPDTLKYFPLFTLALIKCKIFDTYILDIEKKICENYIISSDSLGSSIFIYPKLSEINIINKNIEEKDIINLSFKTLSNKKSYSYFNGVTKTLFLTNLSDENDDEIYDGITRNVNDIYNNPRYLVEDSFKDSKKDQFEQLSYEQFLNYLQKQIQLNFYQ